jgi:hypothetical protein
MDVNAHQNRDHGWMVEGSKQTLTRVYRQKRCSINARFYLHGCLNISRSATTGYCGTLGQCTNCVAVFCSEMKTVQTDLEIRVRSPELTVSQGAQN